MEVQRNVAILYWLEVRNYSKMTKQARVRYSFPQIKNSNTKGHAEVEVQLYTFLTSPIRWTRIVSLSPQMLYPGAEATGINHGAGWVLYWVWVVCRRRKFFCCCHESNHDSSHVHFTAWALYRREYHGCFQSRDVWNWSKITVPVSSWIRRQLQVHSKKFVITELHCHCHTNLKPLI
jgi:hypothetical protein